MHVYACRVVSCRVGARHSLVNDLNDRHVDIPIASLDLRPVSLNLFVRTTPDLLREFLHPKPSLPLQFPLHLWPQAH